MYEYWQKADVSATTVYVNATDNFFVSQFSLFMTLRY